MAIIVSDSRNPAYDGNLTTANGWWRVEASNLAGGNTTALALSATRTIAVTFANAGNLRGVSVGLNITNGTTPANVKGTVTLVLKESGVTRQTVSLTKDQIRGNTPNGVSFQSFWCPTFEFNYPVTTAAGVWTIEISNSGAEAGNWNLATSNGTAPFYVAWCDNQVTASSGNDALVIRSNININASFTTKCNGLGTGDAVNGCSIMLLSSQDVSSPENICNLRWEAPAASYTLTIDGVMMTSADSGFRIGTQASPIPFSTQAVVVFATTPSFGTARGIITVRSSNTNCGASSFIFYGQVPAERMLRTNADAATEQPNVVLTTAPTTWQVGDRVWLPKINSTSPSYAFNTVLSIAGSTVTFNANISTLIHAGSPAINFERYGIRIASANTTIVGCSSQVPNNLIAIGVLFDYFSLSNIRTQGGQNPISATASTSQIVIEDCFHTRNTAGGFIGNGLEVPANGFKINRLYSYGQLMPVAAFYVFGTGAGGGPWASSGLGEVTNNITHGSLAGGPSAVVSGVGAKFNANEMYSTLGNATSGQASVQITNFIGGEFNNNYFFRQNNTVAVNSAINTRSWGGNKFNHSAFTAYNLVQFAVGVTSIGDEFGQEGANLNDVVFNAGSFTEFQIQSPKGNLVVSPLNQLLIVNSVRGSLRVTNENQVDNVDRIVNQYGFIVRCGTGLPDTTKRNGDYCIRLQSISNADTVFVQDTQPTGNIQSSTMSVGFWVKINSANYWAAGHQMPRVEVNYDNGTLASTTAAQTTNWQFLQVTFTPATSYGQIVVKIDSRTEATGTNAYVYFADFSSSLPQGRSLSLGSMNLWANALPVFPLSYSSLVQAADIWTFNDRTLTSGAAPSKEDIADTVLRRSTANIEASSTGDPINLKSLYGMVAQGVHNTQVAGAILTVTKSDDVTVLGTRTVTTNPDAQPIVGIDSD